MQTCPAVALTRVSSATLAALAVGDLTRARESSGLDLPETLAGESWLYRMRQEQIAITPADADWVARLVLTPDGTVAGHAGFHGGPDDDGMVEVSYFVVPEHRGHGYARAALGALVEWGAGDPAVRTLRASVSPGNQPSLAVVERWGFARTGDQWDDVDGLEWVFERPARRSGGH